MAIGFIGLGLMGSPRPADGYPNSAAAEAPRLYRVRGERINL